MEIPRYHRHFYLPDARREAYGIGRAGEEYARIRDAAAPADTLENLVSALRRMQHPTVWREMLRQRARIPELKVLFAEVPGALGW